MKKRTIAAIVTGLAVILILMLSGCNNMIAPSFQQTGGKGTVTVSFSAGRAALSPADMDFDFYEFIFYRNGEIAAPPFVKSKSDNFTFTLEQGSGYTLKVNTYMASCTPGIRRPRRPEC